jgi:hypothetical protein
VPLSFLMGVIGCFVDRPRWLAIVMTAVVGLILVLIFLPLLGRVLC